MQFIYDDGGRSAAGFKGTAGDCVARAIAIASGEPYAVVYSRLAQGNAGQRVTKHSQRHKATAGKITARFGIWVQRKWFKDYMTELGFRWVPTMTIGSGCKVHLVKDELPSGRLVVSLSRHMTAVIGGVIHDTFDPSRETHCTEPYKEPMPEGYWTHDGVSMHHIARRCVYGYYTKEG